MGGQDARAAFTIPRMDDNQLLRYSRHILLRQVDVAGQEKLLAARVLVIGLGGLGSPVAMYLAASGVGHLVIVDHDKVELTNLQRQIVHTTASIGESKAASAAKVSPAEIRKTLEEFKALRFADETIYLRSGSLNIMNGMIGLTFSCDGSHYMSVQEFLEKDLSFWIGTRT